MDPEFVPWGSRDEWIDVYEDAYSGDYLRTLNAVKIMTQWVHFMGSHCRPGMNSTSCLLDIALKDTFMFPETQDQLKTSNLELMYSAEVMRFLNLVCGSRVEDRKNVSLYGRAKALGIPDWVVNIRHQMAHSNTLTSIEILRMAVRFILDWLKNHYWEEERKGMKEVILEEPNEVITEQLTGLLLIYISLKEQLILGFKTVVEIQDPQVKQIILEINSFSFPQVQNRCTPWELKRKGKYINIMKFRMLSIPLAIYNVLNMIKPYFKADKIYGVNTMDILVDKMIDDSLDHGGMRREIWKGLIKAMHSWNKIPLMISTLTVVSYEASGEHSYQAGMWNVELCKALQKRWKVEALSNELVGQVTRKRTYGGKEIFFQPNEIMEFTRIMKKKHLDIFNKKDERRLSYIFLKIEDGNRDLREVIRLKEAIFPDRWEVLDLLYQVSLHPTQFAEQCLISLYDILKFPFSQKDFDNLIGLTKIFRAEGLNVTKRRKIYTLHSKNNLPSNILEEFSGTTLSYTGEDVETEICTYEN